MKVRNSNGEIKKVVLQANDSIPAGSVIDFDGDVVPEGYEKVEEEEIVLYENTSGLASGGADTLKKSVSKYKILGVYTSTGYEIIYYGGLNKNCWGNKTALYFFNNGNTFNVYNTTLYKIVALY